MTGRRRGSAPFVLLAVAALVVSGCSQERASERLPRTQPSASSNSGEDSETAEKRALTSVYQLIDGRDAIRQRPGTYREASSIGFADDKLATEIIAESLELESEDRKQEGEAKLTTPPTPVTTDLNPPEKKGQAVAPFVSVRGCVDDSAVHVVDAKGRKVKGSDGRGPHPVEFHVINRSWPSSTGWRVAWTKDLKGSC
ncbi:hypothetical protein [Janibacter sp. GS2]|uniref:hypothetical protein n=1 Tax=Janibacter sp. GS2 TaxID=3442646 RepID=UPI003EB8CBE1